MSLSSISVIPGLQRREVGGYSFVFSHSVDAFWEFGIWGKSFTSRAVEFVWLSTCDRVGSCRVGELGRDSCFGPLTFPNPRRPFSPNLPLVQPPLILPTFGRRPPLISSFPNSCSHTPNPSRPPSPPPKVLFVAARIYVASCKSSIVFGGGKKGGRKGGEPKMIFVFISCSFVLQSN
jgi:hypothetical protein